MTKNSLTVLQCTQGHRAAKIHDRQRDGSIKTVSHNAGKHFYPRTIDVPSIRDLHALLEFLGERLDLYIIRGELNPIAPLALDGTLRRLKYPRPAEGIPTPFFTETSRTWVMLDFDEIPNPKGLDPLSIEATLYLRNLLPPEFHDVSFSYSFSASAGLSSSSRLNAHLWFMLDRPLGELDLKAWLGEYLVDTALFGTVQPHYTANPVFTGGLDDPVEQRKGLIEESRSEVQVPNIAPPSRAYPAKGGKVGLGVARGYEAKMQQLGDGDGCGGLHNVITPAIASYISDHGSHLDRQALKADIRKRVHEAQWDLSKRPQDYIDNEISDETLDRSIQDWIDKTEPPVALGYDPVETLPVEQARKQTDYAVSQWVDAAIDWQESKSSAGGSGSTSTDPSRLLAAISESK